MEVIDIESLDFDKYNREIYQENNSKFGASQSINAQKKYKNMINKFVENYYKKMNDEKEAREENFERNKKRKY